MAGFSVDQIGEAALRTLPVVVKCVLTFLTVLLAFVASGAIRHALGLGSDTPFSLIIVFCCSFGFTYFALHLFWG